MFFLRIGGDLYVGKIVRGGEWNVYMLGWGFGVVSYLGVTWVGCFGGRTQVWSWLDALAAGFPGRLEWFALRGSC